jgi:hypothetical protein
MRFARVSIAKFVGDDLKETVETIARIRATELILGINGSAAMTEPRDETSSKRSSQGWRAFQPAGRR